MDNLYHLPQRELTPEQTQYWQEKLEAAERAREYCLRQLGKLGIEKGVEG